MSEHKNLQKLTARSLYALLSDEKNKGIQITKRYFKLRISVSS